MTDKNATFADEVKDRLGEFFGNTDKSDKPGRDMNADTKKKSELFDLQSIVLSIEWEISDEIMKRLIAEIDRLMKIYRANKIALSLLKLLDSVGRYINAKKGTSHPDSIKLLHSIHTNLQKVASSKTITESESSQILANEIEKFKNLKQKLLTKKDTSSPVDKKPPVETKVAPTKATDSIEPAQTSPRPKKDSTADTPDLTINPPQDPAIQAINELKMLIKKEFKSIREELKKLRR